MTTAKTLTKPGQCDNLHLEFAGGIVLTREQVLREIAARAGELAGFKVKSLAIFGSVARDEASAESDVDLLVEFLEPVGLFHFVRLKRFLESVLGTKVDLVTRDALKPQLRERILKEAIRAA